MTPPFTLGFEQVRDELMLMQPSGCYWLTANRQEDARCLARQCIAAQHTVTLIASGLAPDTLLSPAPVGGPAAIPLFSLPETRRALHAFTDDLARVLSEKPRLVLFFAPASLWEKLTQDELRLWTKKIQHFLNAKPITLLIISFGSVINALRTRLQSLYRHVDGLAQLDWQQDCWDYRINWWANSGGMLADRALRLDLNMDHFRLLEAEQSTPLTLNDEALYLAEKTVLEGAPPLSSQWTLFDSNAELHNRAQQASAATVIFSLQHNDQIPALAEQIHSLRRTRGSGLKIVVREMRASLRYSDERLLLACGVNSIVPINATMSRFLTMLEGIQGQSYNRHVPGDLSALMKSMQPLQARGYLPLADFCQSVTLLVNNTLLPENGKGLLVALRPVPELKPEQALTLCKPRRYGDLVTLLDDRLYLFLSSCRFSDLNTALKFIFHLPHDEIFTNRLVWHEDLQILSEVRQLTSKVPTAWRDAPAPVAAPSASAVTAPQARRQPHNITLGQDTTT
ncbi:cellulose biosynthesis protein BcsE [Erwinia persicina]|uniref:cellulose biosynthesis protein BcsE n=1 Tax=Erwinia persicina TaxID=55211 RepID=UPI00209FD42A|nr:cellulose biosynthesis protein BcsE [Erwinia persicina]MCP1438790.1 cellulose biosynthesis protein BcsE [Erwinia persicina]